MEKKDKKEKNEIPKETLINGFCSPKCIYFEVRKMVSYTEPSHETELMVCNYAGNARSFGCMNSCLNGSPEYKKEEENGSTENN